MEKLSKSESISKLAAALSVAQAEIKAVEFNSVNPFLKNKYADLGAIIEAAREPLRAHGLSLTQWPVSSTENGTTTVGVVTLISHSSGEWMSSEVSLILEPEKGKSLQQVAGSVITYLRRYSYSAVLGMYADEDVDGNANNVNAVPKNNEPVPVRKAPPEEPKRASMRYLDGSTVAVGNSPTAKAEQENYILYCDAHDQAPENIHNLRNWRKSQTDKKE